MNNTEMDVQTISARQLRDILFYLDRRNITVGELRSKLFDVEQQDKQIDVSYKLTLYVWTQLWDSSLEEVAKDAQTISVRQLREILFYLDNQNMTVNDLRNKLFDVKHRDKQVEVNFAMYAKFDVK
jgi:SHS2 domain-containing protein